VSILENISSASLSLIWGNLRNLIDFDTIEIPTEITLTGKAVGTFPVRSFHPILLEIPKNRKKLDISGRSNQFNPKTTNRTDWHLKRVVSLPIYKVSEENFSNYRFKSLFKTWQDSLIPEDIPCLSLAINTIGQYCDEREGQYVVVMLIWSDSTARIIELDWFEGPLEDCITPEWYIDSSEWLSLETAFAKLKNIFSRPSYLENACYLMFINPSCLGHEFQGKKSAINCDYWEYEWIYRHQLDLIKDLEFILEKIKEIMTF